MPAEHRQRSSRHCRYGTPSAAHASDETVPFPRVVEEYAQSGRHEILHKMNQNP